MSGPQTPRRPRVFSPDDPNLVQQAPRAEPLDSTRPGLEPPAVAGAADEGPPLRGRFGLPTAAGVSRGVRFGAIFVSAVVSLATLAASISFLRFASVALERDDWVGWTAIALLGIAALSGLVLLGREIVGMIRLARLGRLRRDFDTALVAKDAVQERDVLSRLKALYAGRADLRWPLDRMAEHERDIHDPGSLLALADRELMVPLDVQARQAILKSAKRVSTVTAISPFALLAVFYVLVENAGLLRRLATIYGGRPGVIGSLRLARLVVAHIVGTGGVALTDDLIGQFFGQDLLRRLSRRLGEGAFNGALTVRLGSAALDIIRPMPFIEAPSLKARDIIKDLFVTSSGKGSGRQSPVED